jgi:hypothetical protein
MKKTAVFVFLFSIALYIMGCSAEETIQKEEVKEQKPVQLPPKVMQPVDISYDFTDRYFLPNSNIVFDKSDAAFMLDPIVGDFVQFKKGDKNTFVFHRFEIDSVSNEKTNEIVFAFETIDTETGVKIFPEKFIYYYLSYKDSRSRVDGETINGYVILDEVNDNAVLGNLSFSIDGKRKEFNKEDVNVTVEFKGSFRIPISDISSNLR